MILFTQQLFAEGVERNKLSCQDSSILEALSHQHDFTNQLKIWNDHGAGSEESLQILRKLCPPIEKKNIQGIIDSLISYLSCSLYFYFTNINDVPSVSRIHCDEDSNGGPVRKIDTF